MCLFTYTIPVGQKRSRAVVENPDCVLLEADDVSVWRVVGKWAIWFHLSSLYGVTLPSGQQKHWDPKSGPQTHRTTYFVDPLHLAPELTAGKRAIPRLERTANTPPHESSCSFWGIQ